MGELREIYDIAGSDAEKVLARFGGNEEMLKRFLCLFAQDSSFSELQAALAAGNDRGGFLRMRTPLKKENVLQHFAYTWWAYLLAAVLILFSWSMIYNATEYVPPADKTLQITLVGNFVSQDVLDYYTEKAQEEFPEMEKITVDNIPLDFTGEGDYSGYTKLTVVISVGEGDIYLLNRDLLVGYSSMQAFMPLDDEVA